MEVASEMVKELEITDYDPLEIAVMIDEEISALVPSWQNKGYSNFNQQHSFNYNDDDDDDDDDDIRRSLHHPFYSPSSHHSSCASLTGLFTSSSHHNYLPQGNYIFNFSNIIHVASYKRSISLVQAIFL